jgi:hypothetical protein
MTLLLTDEQITTLNSELDRVVLNDQNLNLLSFCNDDQNGRVELRTCLGDESGYYPLVDGFDFEETLSWLQRLANDGITELDYDKDYFWSQLKAR